MPEILLKPDGDPRSLLERWGKLTLATDPDVPEDMQAVARGAVRVIDGGVDLLRNPRAILHKPINKLMANFWRLVGNQITPFAVASAIPFDYKGIFFWAEERTIPSSILGVDGLPGMEVRVLQASILIPMDWLDQVKRDRWKQMGGLIYVASQSNDFWHRKFGVGLSKAIEARAHAWEAEFLNYLAAWPDSGFKADEYQQEVMGKYPRGLASLPDGVAYELTPCEPKDFERIDKNEEVSNVYEPPGAT